MLIGIFAFLLFAFMLGMHAQYVTSVFALGTSQPGTTPPSKMGNHASVQDDATFATPINQVSQLRL